MGAGRSGQLLKALIKVMSMFSFFSNAAALRKSAFVVWMALLFILPIEKFSALKYLLAFALLISTTLLVVRARHLESPRLPPLPIYLAAVLGAWALLVSILGPYPLDSLHALLKDLLIQGELLFCAYFLVRDSRDVRLSILSILAGFAVLTCLSAGEVGFFLWEKGFPADGMIPRSHRSFWGGYPAIAVLCLSLLFAYALLLENSLHRKIIYWACGAVGLVLVGLYGSRSPLLVLPVIALIFLVVSKSWKTLLALLLAGTLTVTWLGNQKDLGFLERYKSLGEVKTYVTDAGLSDRLSLWEGMFEIIDQRPWLGYGYGWKKLAWVINEDGFAEKWNAEKNAKTTYYLKETGRAAYGRVNPHNYPLQVIFEIGFPGLGLALAFWLSLLGKTALSLRQHEDEAQKLRFVLLLGVMAYLLLNFANGYWVGSVANVAMVLAGMLLSLLAAVPEAPQENT